MKPRVRTHAPERLESVLHQPNRLAIMTELCARREGCTFLDLKERCGLTDGNLSGHLRSLEAEKLLAIEKSFVNQKPQTLISVTKAGRDALFQYLEDLERILHETLKKVGSKSEGRRKSDFDLKRYGDAKG